MSRDYSSTHMRITENSRWSAWSVDSMPTRRPRRRSIKRSLTAVVERIREFWKPKRNNQTENIPKISRKQNRSPISDESFDYLHQS